MVDDFDVWFEIHQQHIETVFKKIQKHVQITLGQEYSDNMEIITFARFLWQKQNISF